MEAGGKDCEEETLQTAFKKLRVDAESLPGAVSVSEASTPRAASRVCVDSSGAKTKVGCTKDTWHCCVRKTSRGASSRSQRRRRSKSPILHPPKFTYCSSSALSAPAGCLKHQRLSLSESAGDDVPASSAGAPVQTEASSSAAPGCVSPLVFGVCPGYGGTSLRETTTTAASPRWDGERSGDVQSSRDGAEDFRSLSELHSSAEGPPCSCAPSGASDPREEGGQESGPHCSCRSHQGWSGMEVYSFTGLRSVISECEGNPPSHRVAPRTVGAHSPSSSSSSGSPRSCSEQARAYVDDITIEDLSGYMEYYLYIPKKMSHMAEMMYT